MTLVRAVKDETVSMNKGYYLKNLIIGLVIFSICVYILRSDDNAIVYIVVSGINAFLFPFAKKLVENTAFRYSSKKFWGSGPLSTAAANGGYALLYGFYFMFSIPLGLIFIISFYIKKNAAM
jgi:hypothetical protein